MTTTTCPNCTTTLPTDQWEDTCRWAALTDQSLCESCEESDLSNASTIIKFSPTEQATKALFGDHFICHGKLDELYDSDVPDWLGEVLPDQWTGRVWHSSNAWRGYFNTDSVLKLTKIEDGWMTGDWGDVPWKKDIHGFLDALAAGELVPPCPVYILFEPTSNVFSTATTVLSKPDDADAVKEWLAGSEYDLHRALS